MKLRIVDLFPIHDLNGDFERDINPLEQFMVRLIYQSKKLVFADVKVDMKQVFISVEDANIVYEKLKSYILNDCLNDGIANYIGANLWIKMGPQVNSSLERGKMILGPKHLVIKLGGNSKSISNQMH